MNNEEIKSTNKNLKSAEEVMKGTNYFDFTSTAKKIAGKKFKDAP